LTTLRMSRNDEKRFMLGAAVGAWGTRRVSIRGLRQPGSGEYRRGFWTNLEAPRNADAGAWRPAKYPAVVPKVISAEMHFRARAAFSAKPVSANVYAHLRAETHLWTAWNRAGCDHGT